MATNSIAVNNLLSQDMAIIFKNDTSFMKIVDRQLDNQWNDKTHGFRAGNSYRIDRPARFGITGGNAMGFNSSTGQFNTQNFVEDPIYVTLSVNDQRFIPVSFTSYELSLYIDKEDSKRIGDPASKRLATEVERKSIYETVQNGGMAFIATGNSLNAGNAKYVGLADLLAAQSVLDQLTTPETDRSCLLNPNDQASLARENLTLFTPVQNAEVYANGYINNFAGADFYKSNLLPIYPSVPGVSGTIKTTVTDGATSIALNGLTDGIYSKGTVFTVTTGSDCVRVNPETKDPIVGITGTANSNLYQFVLAQDMFVGSANLAAAKTTTTLYVDTTDSNKVKLRTYPAGYTLAQAVADGIAIGGQAAGEGTAVLDSACAVFGPANTDGRQNIGRLPVATNAVAILGSATKNYRRTVMFHETAYTATMVPLVTDIAGANAQRNELDGFSVRVMDQVQSGTDVSYKRFDALSVAKLVRPEFAVTILSEI